MNLLFKMITSVRKIVYQTLGSIDRVIFHTKNPVVILSYHSISNDAWRFSVSEDALKKQITYLKNHFEIITLKKLSDYLSGKKKLTRPAVILTFDDGYKDILKMESFFNKHKIKPALFVLANSKNPNRQELGNKKTFLNKKEIQHLHNAGWEIGCHSATHANLATLSQEELDKEIVQAKHKMEKQLGFSIPYFAYPRGKYNENVVRLVKVANYLMGFTMDDGIIKPNRDVYTIPRIGIDNTHTFSEFVNTFSPSVVRFRGLIKLSPVGRYL
ncbi:MAG: polysaccharide deacetylase family protein [Candidatus Levyibacteriota bacterium]